VGALYRRQALPIYSSALPSGSFERCGGVEAEAVEVEEKAGRIVELRSPVN
jgi:hypothetical protein